MIRHTKIVATIGPASQDKHILEELIQSGINVARLNFSHGNYQDHAAAIENIRSISQETHCPVTILQDLQGPKIRTGVIQDGEVELIADQILSIIPEEVSGNSETISVDYPDLLNYVNPGDRILLDDGKLELNVIDVSMEKITCRVVLGGPLKSHKGLNLPGVELDIQGFTEKDQRDLEFGLAHGVDAVAVSFVQSAQDINEVRQAIEKIDPEKKDTPIIAKLERPEAMDNLDEIVLSSDGVMVARGDLGVEMSPEAVPIAQKIIIETANKHGRVVITATQMLDSMITNRRPTRAEASDVANAIFDGTDGVMLSGETSIGKYPIQSVKMMDTIICQAEEHMPVWGHWQGMIEPESESDDAFYVSLAACELAHDRNVAAISVFTKSGRTALLMSKTRPDVPILAFTPIEPTFYRMNLYWGVIPHLVPHAETIEDMLQAVEQAMITSTPIKPGQQVVFICGFPVDEVRPANLALLHTVGESL